MIDMFFISILLFAFGYIGGAMIIGVIIKYGKGGVK